MILVADDFHFAEWFKERAPIYSILAKAVAFTILLLIFHIVEEMVVGKFKGKTLAESFPHVGDGSPQAFFYMMIVFAIALIPFFSFKEIVECLASVNCVLSFSHRQSGHNVHSARAHSRYAFDQVHLAVSSLGVVIFHANGDRPGPVANDRNGHEVQSSPPGLSGRCGFRKRSFAADD